MDGDYAGLEIATRYVFTGRTLLGPYSRFMFNHPGPLYFFVIAPIYVLLGRTEGNVVRVVYASDPLLVDLVLRKLSDATDLRLTD